ncbi:MAG: 50S ribosomal protein L15 [Erythrobacter sp.]
MKLNDLRDNEGARKGRMRKGRGIGSGKGKTAARGQKGQKSRSGVAIKGFGGGQMPLHMRLPKRGFNNPFGKDFAEVNIGMVQKYIDAKKLDGKKDVTEDALRDCGLIRGGKDGVRLLGKGEITAKVKFIVAGATKGAIAAVEKAGGSVEVVASVKPSSKPSSKPSAKKETAEKAAPKKAAPKKAAAEKAPAKKAPAKKPAKAKKSDKKAD